MQPVKNTAAGQLTQELVNELMAVVISGKPTNELMVVMNHDDHIIYFCREFGADRKTAKEMYYRWENQYNHHDHERYPLKLGRQ